VSENDEAKITLTDDLDFIGNDKTTSGGMDCSSGSDGDEFEDI
jgi:hypothetical protein